MTSNLLTTTNGSPSAPPSIESWPTERLAALRPELGPYFANDAQRQFYDSRAPEILYSGAMGAGKSRIGCEKIY